MKDVAGQARRVQPGEHIFTVADVAPDQGYMGLPVMSIFEHVDGEGT